MVTDPELETMKERLRGSFLKIKNEMQELKSSIDNLSEDNLHLKSRVSEIETMLRVQNQRVEDKLSTVSPRETKGSQNLGRNQSPPETKGSQSLRQHKPETLDPLEQDMLKQLNKNKKQVIQNHILKLLHNGSLSPWDLKEAIVDKSKYCSKSSFYRYLKELIKAGLVTEITDEGTAALHLNNANI
jgi:hypothetical protein